MLKDTLSQPYFNIVLSLRNKGYRVYNGDKGEEICI